MALSDGFYRAVHGMALQLGVNPADLLLVWYAESGLDPGAVNPKGGARGLIQFMPATLRGMGMSEADIQAFPTWSAEQQLPWVRRFVETQIKAYGKPFPNAAIYYTSNFYPAALQKGDSSDTVIVTKADGDAYSWNAGLDSDKDGRITIGDLAQYLDRVAQQPGYRAAYARLLATVPLGVTLPPLPTPSGGGGSPSSPSAGAGSGAGAALLALGAVGVLAWWVWGRDA